jgi:hypothetical protein
MHRSINTQIALFGVGRVEAKCYGRNSRIFARS